MDQSESGVNWGFTPCVRVSNSLVQQVNRDTFLLLTIDLADTNFFPGYPGMMLQGLCNPPEIPTLDIHSIPKLSEVLGYSHFFVLGKFVIPIQKDQVNQITDLRPYFALELL